MQVEILTAEESDVDGTANRVASVTLESDSLSEAPKSFRSKRRKRLPKREKLTQMIIDTHSIPTILNLESNSEKYRMDWEISPSSIVSDFSSSETRSGSDNNDDADDEQSDWPGAVGTKTSKFYKKDANKEGNSLCQRYDRTNCVSFSNSVVNSTSNGINQSSSIKKNGLSSNVARLIERFIDDSQQKELTLHHAFKISLINKFLINTPSIHVTKHGRDTIILKKAH